MKYRSVGTVVLIVITAVMLFGSHSAHADGSVVTEGVACTNIPNTYSFGFEVGYAMGFSDKDGWYPPLFPEGDCPNYKSGYAEGYHIGAYNAGKAAGKASADKEAGAIIGVLLGVLMVCAVVLLAWSLRGGGVVTPTENLSGPAQSP